MFSVVAAFRAIASIYYVLILAVYWYLEPLNLNLDVAFFLEPVKNSPLNLNHTPWLTTWRKTALHHLAPAPLPMVRKDFEKMEQMENFLHLAEKYLKNRRSTSPPSWPPCEVTPLQQSPPWKGLNSSYERGLTAFQTFTAANFSRLENDIHNVSERQAVVEHSMAQQKAQLERLCEQLAIAERVVCPTALDLGFDRPTSPFLVRLSAAEAITKATLLEGTLAKLIHEAGLETTHFELEGDQIGKFFTMRFTAERGLASRRANKFFESLRGPAGGWKDTDSTSPAGKKVKLYFNRDRNPKQIKEEILGKKLVRAITQQLQTANNPQNCYFKKKDNTVFINWQEAAQIEVSGPDAHIVRWNMAIITPLGIDKEPILAALEGGRAGATDTLWSV